MLIQRHLCSSKDVKQENIYRIASGNCALVTKKVDICLRCNRSMNLLISGYIIGSPTRDKAQCCSFIPSANLSGRTPGTPVDIVKSS